MSEVTGQRGALGELHAITEAGARLVKPPRRPSMPASPAAPPRK
jgi:hypothetical protein